MTLDYIALGMLIFVALVIFYGVIVIHDIPYELPPPSGRHSLCRLGEPVYPACAVAVSVDLGHTLA